MQQGIWTACFGDKRLGKRGDLLFERMVAEQRCSLRGIGQGRCEVLGFHRFLMNEKVTAGEIVASAARPLGPAARGLHVLAIQDTTEVNFERHAGRVKGLGPAGNGRDRGLFVHPAIAIDADSGALLGLAGAQLWTRPEQARQSDHQALPIEDKESHRWLAVAEQAKRALAEAAHVTVVADRESDIYEEWTRLPDARCDLITRACWNRSLADGGSLFAAAGAWPQADARTIELRAQPGRLRRTAKLALHYGTVIIKRPRHCSDRSAPKRLTLTLVELREVETTAAEPIHWRLLTTHRVDSLEAAWQIVHWYRQRWHIEQLFRTMKSQGLDLEASQVSTAEGLLKLSAMATVAAVRIMQLVLGRDGSAQRPASDLIAPALLPVASALQARLEGKTAKQKNPHAVASLAWLAWIVARLGGWNGYPSERPPGPITMGRGWAKFEAIAYGWVLNQDV